MKKVLIFLFAVLACHFVNAQNLGIGTTSPNGSALLDVSSTTKGLLIPRMTSAQRIAIATPATGLMVYETTTSSFWFYNGTAWVQQAAVTMSALLISGNDIFSNNIGNVGIGTTTPTEKLQVTDGNIGLFNTIASKNWRFAYVQADDRFAIQEDGTSRLTIANGGSMGIGTIVPNTKAILDIGSTTKGVLFPRMTTSQKFAIATPPNGLMVYDIDKNELNQYDGTTWRAMLNSAYWLRPITGRKIISNLTDSVGIGMTLPTEWLDVNGNIRSRNNILADNSITATDSVSGALYLQEVI